MNIRFLMTIVAGGVFASLTLATGCAGDQMAAASRHAAFQQDVLGSDKPVLVHFCKEGCPRSVILDGPLDQIAREYRGRAVVTKYQLMTAYSLVTDPQIRDAYDITVYPTVVLFVGGKPVQTWVMHYDPKDYRRALDAALGGAPARAALSQPRNAPSGLSGQSKGDT
jgi:thioredoxin 1